MRLAGRIAVVAGGGRGIGRAIALAFAREGAATVVAARSASDLDSVVAEARRMGSAAFSVTADVSSFRDAENVVAFTVEQFGRIDILVNSAGIYGPIGPLSEVDPEAWAGAIQTNLIGTFNMCRATIPVLVQQRYGKVVNLSGGGATTPLPRFSAYAASKAAVVRLTETLAAELESEGIDVNAIAPGAVDTRLQDEVLAAGERAGDLYKRIRTMRDSGEGGTPIDVPADLAVFLASAESDGLSGRLIAAPYDPWRTWGKSDIRALKGTPWYTLRRLDRHTLAPLGEPI